MTAAKKLAPRGTITPAETLPGMSLVEKAIESGMDPVALGQLMDLAERQSAEVARQAWFGAMQQFQAECPLIRQDSQTPNYRYANLATIMNAIRPTLGAAGLSIMFDETTSDGQRHTTCKVSHVRGHTETATFSGPDQAKLHGGANALQQAGAAQSYGRRYALIMALNLTSVDPDDEARLRPATPITDSQVADLDALIDEVGADRQRFMKWAQIEHLSHMPASRYDDACKRLRAKGKQ